MHVTRCVLMLMAATSTASRADMHLLVTGPATDVASAQKAAAAIARTPGMDERLPVVGIVDGKAVVVVGVCSSAGDAAAAAAWEALVFDDLRIIATPHSPLAPSEAVGQVGDDPREACPRFFSALKHEPKNPQMIPIDRAAPRVKVIRFGGQFSYAVCCLAAS